MTIDEAISHLLKSNKFIYKASQKDSEGSKYRMFRHHYKKGKLGFGAIFAFLIDHGYIIDIQKP